MNMVNKKIGQEIRRIRIKKGHSVKDFGELLGNVSIADVIDWERGKYIPTSEQLQEIAKMDNLSKEELLANTNKKVDISIDMKLCVKEPRPQFLGKATFNGVDRVVMLFECEIKAIVLFNETSVYTCDIVINYSAGITLGKFLVALSPEQIITVMDKFVRLLKERLFEEGFPIFRMNFEYMHYLHYVKSICECTGNTYSVVPKITASMLFSEDDNEGDDEMERAYFHPALRGAYIFVEPDMIEYQPANIIKAVLEHGMFPDYSLYGEALIENRIKASFEAFTYREQVDGLTYLNVCMIVPEEAIELSLEFSQMELLQIGESLCIEICKVPPVNNITVHGGFFRIRYSKAKKEKLEDVIHIANYTTSETMH